MMVLLLVGAGGPALIALVAYGLGRARTAVALLVLAVVLGVPALPSAARAYRESTPPPAPGTPVLGCHERSGGDTRCPGG
ncbi:hypothetical protein [Micromonospora auratinigra]|uniref:Uncharacterized protein n=1 Tax=Micromonospora auratinigra TaxID=261654 RepID=A0A1A8ZT91_9ACTN|nr:hypothetical protein [Micromonospora auratinigra]SBT47338.1 hypothetical protein GA0070611_3685 [Micromonospora auratinigra]